MIKGVAQLGRRFQTRLQTGLKASLCLDFVSERRTKSCDSRKVTKSKTRNLKMMLFVLLVLCAGECGVGAMQAYDCGHSEATHTPIDTTAPPECIDEPSDFLPESEMYAQLLRVNGAKTVRAAHCKVTYSTRVYGCHGAYHYSSASKYSSFKVVHDLTPQVCWAAVRQQMFAFDNLEPTAVHTPRGVWRHASGITQGKYRAGGYCDEHATFISGGELHEDSLEETFGNVKLSFVTGIYNAATKEIVFANGVKANADDRRSFDAYSGVLEWEWEESDEADACERLNEIQQGPFDVHAKTNASALEGAIIMTSDKETDPSKRLGVQLGRRVRTCERTCYEVTSLPDYRFCPYDVDGEPVFPSATYDPQQVLADWEQYKSEHFTTRTDHQFLAISLRGKEAARDVRTRLCQAERRTLWNKLQAISGARNPHALRDIYGVGYQLTPAGPAVAYLTKCVPVQVTPAPFSNCTAEVPVTHMGHMRNGTVYFMDPITLTLKLYPEIIHCSELMPPMHQFDGEWMVANPEPVPATRIPESLPASLLTGNRVVDDFSQDVRAGGLLGRQQLLDVRARLLEVDARDAVLTRATAAATQDAFRNQRVRPLGSVLSVPDYQQLQRWGSIPWLFEAVGGYFYFVFTLTACVSLVLSLLRAVITMHQDFALYGWDGGRTLLKVLPHLLGVATLPLNMVRAVVTAHGQTAQRYPGRQLSRLGAAVWDEPPEKDTDVERATAPAEPPAGEDSTALVAMKPLPPAYERLSTFLDKARH